MRRVSGVILVLLAGLSLRASAGAPTKNASESVTIRGHVLLPSGKPDADATVTCTEGAMAIEGSLAHTAHNGSFRLEGCEPGKVWIHVSGNAAAPAHLLLDMRYVGTRLDDVVIRRETGRLVRGAVTDAQGNPAHVRVVALEDGDWNPPRLVSVDSWDGTFALPVSTRPQTIGAFTDDGRADSTAIRGGTADASVSLRLPDGFHVTGTLDGDVDVSDVRVMAMPKSVGTYTAAMKIRDEFFALTGKGTFAAVARVQGHAFDLGILEPGTYRVFADSAHLQAQTRVRVDREEVVHLPITEPFKDE